MLAHQQGANQVYLLNRTEEDCDQSSTLEFNMSGKKTPSALYHGDHTHIYLEDNSNVSSPPLWKTGPQTKAFEDHSNVSSPPLWKTGSQIKALEDHSDVSSPPLWKTTGPRTKVLEDHSAVSSPPLLKTGPRTRASPIYRRRLVSPERAQEIARDREMLMQMIQNMPEDSYELSLKDIVENSMVKEVEQATVTLEKREKSKEHLSPSKRGKMRGNGKRKGLLRTGSMNDEHIALKMFIPTPLSIRKSSKMDPCSKITPRPRLLQEEKVFDKQWWKNKFSVAGESEKNKAGSMNKSRACYSTGRQDHMWLIAWLLVVLLLQGKEKYRTE
ncbi:hypothetical protein IFM89_027244 [Coptis chinensis]|uniref:Uncharacterized protein n=1 Tax=Coptis chinensis TaxID=261450 RepID=A0A835I8E6_9MAGN|nr:hypothetical protein IFM89_027244 [Coptis chinensis]